MFFIYTIFAFIDFEKALSIIRKIKKRFVTNTNLRLTILIYHSLLNTQYHAKTKISSAMEEVSEGYHSGKN